MNSKCNCLFCLKLTIRLILKGKTLSNLMNESCDISGGLKSALNQLVG